MKNKILTNLKPKSAKNYFYRFLVLIPIFSILNFFVLINNSEAQWIQTNGIYGGIVYSLAISGNNFFAGTDGNGIYLSTDNGSNWTQFALNNRTVYSLVVNGNYIFAGTDQYGVYLSTNNGSSWIQTALNNLSVRSIAINGNYIFAGIWGYGVYLSTNNGSNWTQIGLNNQYVNSIAISGNNIFAGTQNYTAGSGGVYLSTNNGSSWVQTTLNNIDVRSLVVSGNNIFAGTGNGIYLSTNNGSSWTKVGLNNQHLHSFAVIVNNIFAGSENGVYLSTNNGSSWIEKNQGFYVTPTVNVLLIANDYIFAGTYAQSVWRRLYSEAIGIQKISTEIPSSFSLSQNYPNPFNPITKIRFDLPKNVNVKLTIYDMLGREVETIVNEQLNAGSYEVNWEGTKYTSGVYYYRLNAGEFVETKKMILVK